MMMSDFSLDFILLDFDIIIFQAIDVWMASSIVFVFLSLIEFALVS